MERKTFAIRTSNSWAKEVALHPYDTQWPALFLAERERLLARFPAQLRDVQHIGSTAISGMTAKPVIDTLGGVTSMAVADDLMAPLLRSGYTTSAAFNATLTDRRWLMRWSNGRRTHHLHLVVQGSAEWQRRLRFRNALRTDTHLAQRYASLKNDLMLQHRTDREAYTDGKRTSFSPWWDATDIAAHRIARPVPHHVAFLHTSPVHIATFDHLAQSAAAVRLGSAQSFQMGQYSIGALVALGRGA